MQYTHRLSIQNEGGCRFTGPAEAARVCDSSFLWTCLRGECSKINPTLRGYVADLPLRRQNQPIGQNSTSAVGLQRVLMARQGSGVGFCIALTFERRKQGPNGS